MVYHDNNGKKWNKFTFTIPAIYIVCARTSFSERIYMLENSAKVCKLWLGLYIFCEYYVTFLKLNQLCLLCLQVALSLEGRTDQCCQVLTSIHGHIRQKLRPFSKISRPPIQKFVLHDISKHNNNKKQKNIMFVEVFCHFFYFCS